MKTQKPVLSYVDAEKRPCGKCGKTKKRSEFGATRWFVGHCKTCTNAYMTARRQKAKAQVQL